MFEEPALEDTAAAICGLKMSRAEMLFHLKRRFFAKVKFEGWLTSNG
jgi:hypothetical protein